MRGLVMAAIGEQQGGGGMPAGIYHDPTNGLISVSADGIDWITIADKNLGASVVANVGDPCSELNCGGVFQWGNNYMFPYTGPVKMDSTQVDITGYGPGNYYNNDTFVTNYTWATGSNITNLWGGTSSLKSDRQGPCPNGFYVPARSEVGQLISMTGAIGVGNSGSWRTYLKVPTSPQYIKYEDGTPYVLTKSCYFWTSTNRGGYNIMLSDKFQTAWSDSYGINIGSFNIGNGTFIRPFKIDPVIPDSSRTVLYQPSS